MQTRAMQNQSSLFSPISKPNIRGIRYRGDIQRIVKRRLQLRELPQPRPLIKLQPIPQQQPPAAAARPEGYKSLPQPALSTESFSLHTCGNCSCIQRKPKSTLYDYNPKLFFQFIYVFFCPSLTTEVPPAVPPSLPVPARDFSRSTSLIPRLQPVNPPAAPVPPHPPQHPPQLPDTSLPGTSLLSIPAPLQFFPLDFHSPQHYPFVCFFPPLLFSG